MTELDLYKFIQELAFQLNFNEEEKEIYCFFYLFQFETLTEKIQSFLDSLDEGVFRIELRQDYFVFGLKAICEHYEIDIFELSKHLDFDSRG